MYVQTPTHKFEESNTARHEHAGMAEQSENVEYAGAAVASPLRQRNAEDLPDVTSAIKERTTACLSRRGRRLVNSPQTARQAALRAMWDEAATENYGQYNRLEVPHMLLDDVRVGDVVELTAGQLRLCLRDRGGRGALPLRPDGGLDGTVSHVKYRSRRRTRRGGHLHLD